MSDQAHAKLGGLLGRCAKDSAFRARFMANPAAVLGENGITIPQGVSVHVVENTEKDVYITLPPVAGSAELSEAELEQVAGGGLVFSAHISPKIFANIFQQATKQPQNGSTCYKDCIPW